MGTVTRTWAAVACAVVLVGPVAAQDRFETNGPYDGSTEQVLAAHDGTVYSVTTGLAAYRSTDDGATWTMCGPNPIAGSSATHHIRRMAVDSSGRLYAASEFGMWRSQDNGDTWQKASNGYPASSQVYNVEISRGGAVFVDLGILTGASVTPAFYRSTNHGSSWEAIVVDESTEPDVYRVSFAPDGAVYATTPGAVWKSINDGTDWSRTALELDTTEYPLVFADRVGFVWAWAPESSVLYLSSDGGDSWVNREASGLPPNTWNSCFVQSSDGAYLMGSYAGVFKSTDTCRTWIDVTPSHPSREVTAYVAPSPSGSIFCAYGFLYRSTDGASAWAQVNERSSPIRTSALARLDDGTLLARAVWGSYRSENNGRTWVPSDSGFPAGAIVGGFIQTSTGQILASTWQHGVYRSTDNGRTWMASNVGLPTVDINGSGITEARGGMLVLATAAGVFRSNDRGARWTSSSTGLPVPGINSITMVEGGVLLAATTGAGISRSTNDGATWSESSNGLTTADVLSIVVAADGSLLAGTKIGGLYRSVDQGHNWEPIFPATLRTLCAWAGRWGVNGAGTIFAGTQALLRSTDNGNSWTASLLTGLTGGLFFTNGLLVRGVTLDAAGRVIVGSRHPTGVQTLLVDSGLSWKRAPGTTSSVRAYRNSYWSSNEWIATSAGIYVLTRDIDDALRTTRVAWSTIDESDVWAFATVNDYVIAGMSDGIRRHDNIASTWRKSDSGLPATKVHALAVRFMGKTVYAGTALGVFRSHDTALSWTSCSNGLGEIAVTQLVISGTGALIASAPGHGLYRSDDDGEHWSLSQEGLPSNAILSLAVIGGRTLYAGTDGAGVYRSDDDGRTWAAGGPELASAVVNTIVVNSEGLVFAGTDDGAYRSTNRGATWDRIIPDQQGRVTTISISGDGRIYVGTDEGLFYSSTARQPSGVDDEVERTSSRARLIATPNPASETCELQYIVPRAGRVRISIYDALGREVRILAAGEEDPGEYRLRFDLHDLPIATYYVRFECVGDMTAKRITVVR